MLIEETTRLARDSFYVTVGFGVIGFQKLQVRRRELEAQLGSTDQLTIVHDAVGQLTGAIGAGVHDLDDLVSSLEQHVDDVIDGVAAHLPGPTRDAVAQARGAARAARAQVVDLIVRPGEPDPSS